MNNENHDRRKLLELDVLGDTTKPLQHEKVDVQPESSQAYTHVTFTLFLLMGCSSLSVMKVFPPLQLAHGWNNIVRSQNFPDLDDALGSDIDNFNASRCYEPENEKMLTSLYESYKTLGPRPLTYLVTSVILAAGIFLVSTVSMFIEYFRRNDNEPFDTKQYYFMGAIVSLLYSNLYVLIDMSYLGNWSRSEPPGICGHLENDLEKCFTAIGACLDIEQLRFSHLCAMVSCISTMITYYFVRCTEDSLYAAKLHDQGLKACAESELKQTANNSESQPVPVTPVSK